MTWEEKKAELLTLSETDRFIDCMTLATIWEGDWDFLRMCLREQGKTEVEIDEAHRRYFEGMKSQLAEVGYSYKCPWEPLDPLPEMKW